MPARSVAALPRKFASPGRIELHFSEALVEKFSGAEVSSTRVMMGDKMMDHVMKIEGVTTTLDPADKKAMIVTLKTRADAVEAFAKPYPSRVIATVMGAPGFSWLRRSTSPFTRSISA